MFCIIESCFRSVVFRFRPEIRHFYEKVILNQWLAYEVTMFMSSFSLVYRAEIKGFRYFCLNEAKRCTNALFIPLARVFVNSAWPNFLLPVLYAPCVMSPVFSYQNKETTGTLFSQTNPQGTALKPLNCYLNIFFSEPMKVVVCCYCLFNRK